MWILEGVERLRDLLPLFDKVDVDPMRGCQLIDADLLAQQYHPGVNVCWPLMIGQLYDWIAASSVGQTLAMTYPGDHEVVVLSADEAANIAPQRILLRELDQYADFDEFTYLYVPPLEPGHSFADLQQIVAHLRSPEGCPWDREQTLASLRQDLLSETVEVMEAVDLDGDDVDNGAHIAEELGDVMLLVTMMVQIAIDEGRFQMADVMHHIVRKLIRRHPHVFGDVTVDGSSEVTANWDAIKAQEKADKGQAAGSPLDGVPVYLPALEKARELQSKAAKAGMLDRSALAHSMPIISPSPRTSSTESAPANCSRSVPSAR